MKRSAWMVIVFLGLVAAASAVAAPAGGQRLLVLCYHDVPKEVNLDKYGVDHEAFVQQIEYLRTHGYTFVSAADVLEAQKGAKELPAKPVLLTFDDAYATFADFVLPVLKLYGIPCVLGVVTSWIDEPPPGLPGPLMSWEQLKDAAQSGLVEIASHSDKLHQAVIYNPYGNTSWAAVSRIFDSETQTYETAEAFRQRVAGDIKKSLDILKTKLGVDARLLVWPYGQYNAIGLAAAREAGIELTFELDAEIARLSDTQPLTRVMLSDNPSIQDFIRDLKRDFALKDRQRVVHLDLDMIYDDDPQQRERNLDALVERLYAMKPSTVYLQAFCDEKGTGNIESVYFPNDVLPMKADIFNRVVNQLAIRGISVYAWMPMLSIVLPDLQETQALRVREWAQDEVRVSGAAYQRLSPFSCEAVAKIRALYEAMAVNARIAGVVFLDDGYLNDFEDFHPDAMREYAAISGSDRIAYPDLDEAAKTAWVERKTQALDSLAEELSCAVRRHRPHAKFARTLYAETVLDPRSQEWLSQEYERSLCLYDYVVLMAYPRMEKAWSPEGWLKKLVARVRAYPDGLAKTVFKVQSYDWARKKWISDRTLLRWMRALVAAGAQHIGYYPDDCLADRPQAKVVRLMMSLEDFPFRRGPETGNEGLYR